MQVEIELTHTWKKRKNNKQLTEVIWQRNKRLDKLKQPNVNLKISSRNTILKLIFFFSYLRHNTIFPRNSAEAGEQLFTQSSS